MTMGREISMETNGEDSQVIKSIGHITMKFKVFAKLFSL